MKHIALILSLFTFGLGADIARAAGVGADEADIQFFESKVRPLLAERCYQCHSVRAEKVKGSLLLDSRDSILKGGDNGPALVPGHPDQSRLVEAIQYGNPDLQMPPKDRLTEKQVADLIDWVKRGAPWPAEPAPVAVASAPKAFDLDGRKASHWAWQPIHVQPPPAVKDAAWVKSDADRFILAKLEEKGMHPAGPAEKRALIRRAYFDVIGLPPSPADVDAFVQDASPEAFAKVIDRLLASPQYGERWSRHWLDLARYAEGYGHEFDFPIDNAWRYRDYVIRAFNADLPYNQFVTEQIAGDLLEHPRLHPTEGYNESVIGTGFWLLGEAVHAPVDARENQADRIDNQVDVMGKTFLALTLGCARCHDHKFDAISTKDYYSLWGFMESSRRQETELDPHGRLAKVARQLVDLHTKKNAELTGALSKPGDTTRDEFAAYLLAAHDVIRGIPSTGQPDPVAAKRPEIVFDDFESRNYDGWKVEGTAFGDGPQTQETVGKYQGDVGAFGKGFVNSHNIRHGENVLQGDAHTGRMTSSAFTIRRKYITFLVGGGNHPGKTCMNLLVDGRVAATVTGHDNNRMRADRFDVAALDGREARLEILDEETGPWGNIGIDHIVFTDELPAGTEPKIDVAHPTPRPVAAVAKERGLDAVRLGRWVTALNQPDVRKGSHPLRAWADLALQADDAAFSAQRERVSAELAAARKSVEKSAASTTLLADFSKPETFRDWIKVGHAFDPGPTRGGDWDLGSKMPQLFDSGLVHSGIVSKRLRGTLVSRDFTLTKPKILYHVAGHGARIRLVIDGYFMDTFSTLLFGGCLLDVNSDDLRWQAQAGDLGRFIGHRAHIEVQDNGDGWIALDEIRLADASEGPPADGPSPLVSRLVDDAASSASPAALASAYGAAWSGALEACGKATADASQTQLINWAIRQDLMGDASGLKEKFAAAAREMTTAAAPVDAPTHALALADGSGVDEHIYIRGSSKTLGAVAPRRFLEALAGPNQAPIAQGSGRLELARRMTDASDPLLPRVMVNRVWHHLFGRGIVASTDNFGVLGERPTHPELLDYLADRFVREGWSVKTLIRELMLTSTYQMSTHAMAEANEADPDDKLLHKARIRRLEGEAIRDEMLAVSGRLNSSMYGPSVDVYLTSFMEGRGRPASGPLDGGGRRSVYLSVRRNFLSPMMLAFDTPIPFSTMGRRSTSNVPAQALILLNDPFVVSQAELWAKRTLGNKMLTTPQQRIASMYEAGFSRPPTDAELTTAFDFLESQAAERHTTSDSLEVWTDLADVLMNVKDFIYLN